MPAPFSQTFWLTPLPGNATIQTSSANVVADLAGQSSFNHDSLNTFTFTVEPIIAPVNQAFVPVTYNGGPGNSDLAAVFALGVPIPPGTTPTVDSDSELVIIQPDYINPHNSSFQGRQYELWKAVFTGGAWFAAGGGRMMNINNDAGGHPVDWVTGPGGSAYATDPDSTYSRHLWCAQGSKLPLYPGLITVADCNAGFINHVVALEVVRSLAGGHVWPAQSNDGNSSTTLVREGQRFRFPAGYVASHNISGLHPIAQMIVQAAETYGIVVTDQSGNLAIRAAPSVGAGGFLGASPSYQVLNNFPWADLQLLAVGSDADHTPTDAIIAPPKVYLPPKTPPWRSEVSPLGPAAAPTNLATPINAVSLAELETRIEAGIKAAVADVLARVGTAVGTFQANHAYLAGQMIAQGGTTYYASADFTSLGAFDAADWTVLPTLGDAALAGLAAKADLVGGLVPVNELPAGTSDAAIVAFSLNGDLAIGQGTKRFYLPTNATIQSVEVALATTPDTTAVIVDANKNGTTLFSTQANRPTVSPGSYHSGLKVPNVTSVSLGDYLTFDVDQIGSVGTGTTDPTFISDTVQATQSSVSTYDVTVPSGIQTGDLWLMTVRWSGAFVLSGGTPAGWTAMGSTTKIPSQNIRTARFYRLYAGEAGPWTFSFTGAVTVFSRKVIYRNVDQTTPVDAFSDVAYDASTGPFSPAALTTTVTNTMLVEQVTLASTAAAGIPSGYTPRTAFNGVGGTSSVSHLGDKLQAASGASDTSSFSLSASVGILIGRTAVRGLSGTPPPWSPGADLIGIVRYLETP